MAYTNHRPLIWDVQNGKPRATPFDHLVPSSTSGRWIGIEKDTQQLVVADEDFEVIKRLEVRWSDKSFGLRLDWSPDERYILWRNQIGFDYYSNWEGFRMDLQTGKKRELSGRFMGEEFGFTGRGGEFYRCGQDGERSKFVTADVVTGAHLTIVPGGDGADIDVWRLKIDPTNSAAAARANNIAVRPSAYEPTIDLFAIGLPNATDKPPGYTWHLMDRNGKSWQMPGKDTGTYMSPYEVIGFAEHGKLIVARDDTNLFVVSVDSVLTKSRATK